MREFRSVHTRGRSRFWIVDVRGRDVSVVWGDIAEDGTRNQHGETTDTKDPKGKEGTKAYVNAEDNAKFHYERLIRKKLEEGYVEVGLDGRPLLGDAVSEIDHSKPLPKNLCFSKPRNSVKDGYLQTMDEDRRVVYTRKVNGMMLVAHVQEDGNVAVYNRRMDDTTAKLPHLVRALKTLKIPPKSILLFEGFLGQGSSKKELLLVQSVLRSLDDRALALQEESGWIKFCLLRIPVLRGVHIEGTMPMVRLIDSMENDLGDKFIGHRDPKVNGRFLYTMEVFNGTSKQALDLAGRNGYEGWVGYVKDSVMGDKSYSFNGKADRPSTCFKLKPDEEDDFIAYWDPDKSTDERPLGTWGTGKNQNRVGTFSLYQIGADGKEYYLSEVGSGLTDADRDIYADPERFPIVVQVKFEERFFVSAGDKTNALQLPRITLIRTDKLPEECVCLDLK